MARDTYTTSGDPRDLLDEDTYPSADDLLRHLLARFLTLAYPDPKQRGHALEWLAWIARHMGTNRDLAWWDIFYWIPQRQVCVELGLVAGVTAGLVAGVAAGLVAGVAAGLVAGVAAGLVAGVAVGLVAGVAAGRTAGQREEPESGRLPTNERRGPMTLAVRRPTGRETATIFKDALVGSFIVLPAYIFMSMAAGAAVGRFMGLPGYKRLWLFFLLGGLVAGLVGTFMVAAGGALLFLWTRSLSDYPAVTPLDAYRAEWRYISIVMLALGLPEVLLFSVFFVCIGVIAGMSAGWLVGLIIGHNAEKFWAQIGLGAGLAFMVVTWLGFGLGPAVRLKIAEAHLLLRGRGRIRFVSLLETALQRQVLRQAQDSRHRRSFM